MSESVRWGPHVLRQGFARVPLTVMYDHDLPLGPKVLYSVIAGHLWGDSQAAWPGQTRLAACCGDVSVETIRRWTRDLEERGLLTTHREPGKGVVYELQVPLPPHTPEGTPPTGLWGVPPHQRGVEEEEEKKKKGRRPSASGKPETLSMDDAAELQDVRADQPKEDLSLIDEWLNLAAASNKTGTITMARRINETRELLSLRDALGEAPWRYGMAAAIHRKDPATDEDAPALNYNYVKKAARSYVPGTVFDGPGTGSARRLDLRAQEEQERLDAISEIDRQQRREEAEREEMIRRERDGQAASE